MNGPSVTPVALIVLALSAESSCSPPSTSSPDVPHFSYQARTSVIHAPCSASDRARASGVSMIRITYFIARLRLSCLAPFRRPSTDVYERRASAFDIGSSEPTSPPPVRQGG